MKVAVCISGFLRTVKSTRETLKKYIIKPNNCDVYVSTWDIWGHGFYKDHQNPWLTMPATRPEEPVTPETIKTLYPNVKDFLIEPLQPRQKIINDLVSEAVKKKPYNVCHDERTLMILKKLMCMHWKIKTCNQLTKKEKYDLIIRCRADLLFHKQIATHLPKSNVICVPQIQSFGYINDQFAFGIPEAMDVYSELYDFIPVYMNQIACVAEGLLHHHLKYIKKLLIRQVPVDYTLFMPYTLPSFTMAKAVLPEKEDYPKPFFIPYIKKIRTVSRPMHLARPPQKPRVFRKPGKINFKFKQRYTFKLNNLFEKNFSLDTITSIVQKITFFQKLTFCPSILE